MTQAEQVTTNYPSIKSHLFSSRHVVLACWLAQPFGVRVPFFILDFSTESFWENACANDGRRVLLLLSLALASPRPETKCRKYVDAAGMARVPC